MRPAQIAGLLLAASCHSSAPSLPRSMGSIAAPGQVGPFVVPPSWKQATWNVDPANSSACASDNNRTCASASCTSGDGPCLSYGSIVSRWGTTSPTLSQNTTITFLSSHTDDSDPVIAKPTLKGGAYLEFTTASTPFLSGTLASVTALNRNTPQLWQASFTGLGDTCAGASGPCLLVDTTTNAIAWLNLPGHSGDIYSISSPLSPAATTAIGQPLGSIVAEKTIANTDSFSVYTKFPAVNIVDLEPIIDAPGLGGPGLVVYRTNVFSPTAQGSTLSIGGGVLLAETSSTRQLATANKGGGWSQNLSNVYSFSHELYNFQTYSAVWIEGQRGFPIIWGDAGGTFLIVGGILNTTSGIRLANANVQQDTLLENAASGGIISENLLMAGAYIGNTVTSAGVYCFGPCSIDYDNTHASGNVVWGPGQLVTGGQGYIRYRTDTLAVNTFLETGGLKLYDSTTGCSFSVAATNVISCGISITPSNLDLANSGVSTGFGGLAIYPGKGAIFKATP